MADIPFSNALSSEFQHDLEWKVVWIVKTQGFCGYTGVGFNSNPDNVINCANSFFLCNIRKIAVPSQMGYMR